MNNSKILYQATINVATVLKLNKNDLTDIIGLNFTLAGLNEINPNTQEGKKALYLIRIYNSLTSKFNDNSEHMCLWLSGFNKGTKGIPINQIKNRNGLIAVMEYLDVVAHF